MSFTLSIRNYRGIRRVDWNPQGVCILVGPNGSGKSTILDVPSLLGDGLERGLARALELHGGLGDLRFLGARPKEAVELGLSVDNLHWKIRPAHVPGSGFRSWERVQVDGNDVVIRDVGDDDATILGNKYPVRDLLALSAAVQTNLSDFERLSTMVLRYRVYGRYDIESLRRSGSQESTERRLDCRGTNVFSVLRNWRDRRADRERVDFVINGLRSMYDNFFDDIEFAKVAQVVGAEMRLKPWDKVVSTSTAPDGWFVALLHLAAVASTDAGDVIAIDEPENALHPHAINALMGLMKKWSERSNVTILLATHSPVIINSFKDVPDKVFVMEPGAKVQPLALDELKDRSWLAHFALGDLYAQEEFGAPKTSDDDHRSHNNGSL